QCAERAARCRRLGAHAVRHHPFDSSVRGAVPAASALLHPRPDRRGGQGVNHQVAMSETLSLRPVVVDLSASAFARVRPVPVASVDLRGHFWRHRYELNSHHALLSQWSLLESTGRLNNFRRVSGEYQGAFSGLFFNDSDLYKWLEAASWVI